MKNTNERIKIKITTDESGEAQLRCPKCSELLSGADIEVYPACPFCGCRFESDENLEDFVLIPVVRHWIGKSLNHLYRA